MGRKSGGFPYAEAKTGKHGGLDQLLEVTLEQGVEAVLEHPGQPAYRRQGLTDSARAVSQLAHPAIPAPVVHEVSKTVSDGLMRRAFARSVPILQLR
jgi:hypothetical protein